MKKKKKDNINILIDDAKIHGALSKQNGSPTSHVVSSNISNVKLLEGPFDVENFLDIKNFKWSFKS